MTRFSDQDVYLFNEGTHTCLYDRLGAHPVEVDGRRGTWFAIWAPEAADVSMVGPWNGWEPGLHPLHRRGGSGIWEGFVPDVGQGAYYKFHLISRHHGYRVAKADPFGFRQEMPPGTASQVWDLGYTWGDGDWMAQRKAKSALDAPVSIYEIHLGSWRRVLEDGGRSLTYREMARVLPDHIAALGYTHIELLPVMEHPFYGSWGYQVSGYFAPTARYGTPQDFMALIDALHRRGIAVILDWVPSHFPTDEHGLGYFDGTHLFEHADPRQGSHPDWNTSVFNFGRHEVRSFLTSNAFYWLDRYHIDALRVDAVASMLYLDYSRPDGGWVPNEYGGRENLEAIAFLRRLNEEVYRAFPDVQVIAEESTSWPLVSRPVYVGGLGFGMKWDMGWMHDTLGYMARHPVHRKYHHNALTFRNMYAHSENFILPLSHDEVVHGKGSLLGRMPGDPWQMFANLRLLYGWQYGQPGKKLLFMGGEFGQVAEWNHDASLDWHLLGHPWHAGLMRWVTDLNHLYRDRPACHELDMHPAGFEWVDCTDAEHGVLAFLRFDVAREVPLLFVFNFTPIPRQGYRIGVPRGGRWTETLNGDAEVYGGSGLGNQGGMEAEEVPWHGHPHSLSLTLPPLACVVFTPGA